MQLSGKNLSRFIGMVWILTSILWGILGVMGILYVSSWIENTQAKLDNELVIVYETLESVRIVIDETTDVISSTNNSLGTVQKSVHDASNALTDLRPLLWKTTKVVTLDVPDALDGMQASMPSLIETAKSVDETLTWLSNFELTIPNPFGRDWSYDLGISYDPEVRLDQALVSMNRNLEDIPEDLRELDESLSTADANLIVVSDDLAFLAGDIETTNQQVGEVVPQLENLGRNIEDIQVVFQETQISIIEMFEVGRKVITAILFLLIFTQIPSLYMGVFLIRGEQFSQHSSDYSNKST